MINYSVLSGSFVFSDWEDFEPQYETIDLSSSSSLVVERLSDKEVKVVRLISSRPEEYLKSSYQPGSVLKSKLHLK